MQTVDVWILIPLKRLADAKQRLASVMDGGERERLMLSMVTHVALAESAGLAAVVLDRPGLALDVDTPDDVLRAGLRLPA